jgi:uncharacterized protein (UPF0332 family)
MFYLAEALLLGRGFRFSKHSAVISAFGREFAKTGDLSADHQQHLLAAEKSRIIGDYDSTEHVTADRAQEHLDHAAQFLAAAEASLRRDD